MQVWCSKVWCRKATREGKVHVIARRTKTRDRSSSQCLSPVLADVGLSLCSHADLPVCFNIPFSPISAEIFPWHLLSPAKSWDCSVGLRQRRRDGNRVPLLGAGGRVTDMRKAELHPWCVQDLPTCCVYLSVVCL